MSLFLTINDAGTALVVLKDSGDVVATITSVIQLDDLQSRAGDIYCSSSIDFPSEFTQDPAVLALCREVQLR